MFSPPGGAGYNQHIQHDEDDPEAAKNHCRGVHDLPELETEVSDLQERDQSMEKKRDGLTVPQKTSKKVEASAPKQKQDDAAPSHTPKNNVSRASNAP